MKLIFIIATIFLIYDSVDAQFLGLDEKKPDSTSVEHELIESNISFWSGISCSILGTGLIITGNAISNGKIETTFHPDNCFVPGYFLVGLAFYLFINSWTHQQNAIILINREKQIGIAFQF